jgi:hypothetical protein
MATVRRIGSIVGTVLLDRLALKLAIVRRHFSLAFFWEAARMTAGANPAFGRSPEAKPDSQLPATGWAFSKWLELVGIEPAAGLPVTAMATSPWIAPQR